MKLLAFMVYTLALNVLANESSCTNTVSISVPKAGSIGVQLDSSLIVQAFALGSPVEASGKVAMGDKLSAVNGNAVRALSDLGNLLRAKPGAKDRQLTFSLAKEVCSETLSRGVEAPSGTLTLTHGLKKLMAADFRQAHYGGPLPFGQPIKVVYGEPLDGCSPLRNAETAVGAAVLLTRGKCPFLAKSRHAMAAGAALVVFMNSEIGLPRVPAMGSMPSDTIPIILVTQTARRRLRQIVEPGKTKDAVMLTLAADHAVEAAWDVLHRLCKDVKHWPESAQKRKKRYYKLSMQHHPDKLMGSDERFEALRYAYKKALYFSNPSLQKEMHFDEFLASR